MDVVPAEARLWKEPPFSGANRGGYIWGRGALDMKGPAILELMSMILMKRQKVPLKGDVIFSAPRTRKRAARSAPAFCWQSMRNCLKTWAWW